MISINLIIKKPPLGAWRKHLPVLLALLLLVAGALADGHAWRGRAQVEARLAETRALLQGSEVAGLRLTQLERQLAEADQVVEALAAVARNQQFNQAVILRTIMVTPPGVQVTEVVFRGDEVEITGRAGSFEAAMQYVDYLRTAPDLSVAAEKTARIAEGSETTFTCVARVRGEVGL